MIGGFLAFTTGAEPGSLTAPASGLQVLDMPDDDNGVVGAVGAALGLQGERIENVTYSFTTDGPDIAWRVRRLHWVEGMSYAYEMRIDVSTADEDPDVDSMLGSSIELLIERGSHLRRSAYGMIQSVEYIGFIEDHLWLSLVIVPAFRLLSQRVDTRIFQGKTVVEIIDEVLGKDLADFDREVDTTGLAGDYNARDFCVQFRESTFDFCCRLLEEEGISYYFQPDDDTRHERLVLADANDQYADVDLIQGEDVPIMGANVEQADRESIQRYDWEQKRVVTKLATRGFNFKTTPDFDEADAEAADEFNPRVREVYTFDDRRQITDDPNGDPMAQSFTGEGLDQRQPMADNRMKLSVAGSKTARGASNHAAFMAGMFFALGTHQREDLDGQRFLITRVIHRSSGSGSGTGARYSNTFEAIPEAHEHRPALLTPRPRVHGAQTAIVVGPAGQEIHTDKHGRIKIQFHWDRLQPNDENASCWTRVVQPWAGSRWGGIVIPRIGMEVVVDFLDGNPDRPLVVGCVYNKTNPPPYTLPDEKTKSTFKTNSSPGGGGSNELRFEDAAGAEEIYSHAEKDYNEVVENCHTTTVHNNQTNTVDHNQTQTVTGNQVELVSGDQNMTVKMNRVVVVQGSHSVQIKGAPDGPAAKNPDPATTLPVKGSKLEITGDYKVDVSNVIEIQAPTHILLTCGGSSIKMTPSSITLIAGGGASLVMDGDLLAVSKAGSQQLISADISLGASTGSGLELTGTAVMASAKGASTIDLSGDAKLDSTGKTTISAPTTELIGGDGSVKASGKVEIKGSPVKIDGGSEVSVVGGVVKLN